MMIVIPWKVIDYKVDSLAGEMPNHYEMLDGDTVRATYYTPVELAEHMSRIYVVALVRECEALGGVVTGEIPVEVEPKQAVLMT